MSRAAPDPAAPAAVDERAAPFPHGVFIAGLAVILLLHLWGATFGVDHLWGAHFLYFLPWPETAALVAALAVAWIAARRWIERGPALRESVAPATSARFVEPLAGALLFALLCWWLRPAHLLLGDGLVVVETALHPGGHAPLEPLSVLLQRGASVAIGPLFSGQPPFFRTWSAIALAVAASAAGLFLALRAFALALVADHGAQPAGARAGVAPLVLVSCLAQGFIQIFCGYVENYAYVAAASALYLLLAHRYWTRGGGLLAPGAALLVACALHLSALSLVPGFALLVVDAVADPSRRARTLRELALLILVPAGILFATPLRMPALASGIALVAELRSLLSGHAAGFAHWREALPSHALDVLNEQLLIGPAAAWLFLCAAVPRLRASRAIRGSEEFWLATGGAAITASLLAGDTNLGYARNWDVLAQSGLVLVMSGFALLSPGMRAPDSKLRWTLVAVAALSLFHTVPWVRVNQSEPRALARFARLPLGGGRTESTLGYWYALTGRRELAEHWLVRSLDVAPDNARARVFQGMLLEEEGRCPEAAAEFAAATRARPDRSDLWWRWTRARLCAADTAGAESVLTAMRDRFPSDPRVRTAAGLNLSDPADEVRWRGLAEEALRAQVR